MDLKIAKLTILSVQTHPAMVDLYHCFHSGVTLLECLTLQPTVLRPKEITRAIMSCSSALTGYSRYFPPAVTFLELFEILSDRFLGSDDPARLEASSLLDLRTILQQMMAGNPFEIAR